MPNSSIKSFPKNRQSSSSGSASSNLVAYAVATLSTPPSSTSASPESSESDMSMSRGFEPSDIHVHFSFLIARSRRRVSIQAGQIRCLGVVPAAKQQRFRAAGNGQEKAVGGRRSRTYEFENEALTTLVMRDLTAAPSPPIGRLWTSIDERRSLYARSTASQLPLLARLAFPSRKSRDVISSSGKPRIDQEC